MDLSKSMLRYQSAKTASARRQIAFGIARQLHKKNLDPTEWLKREAADRLDAMDDPGFLFRNFLKIDAWTCCPECAALDGARFTLDAARASDAIPNPSCRHKVNAAGFAFCTCFWEIDMDAYREARDR